MKKRVERLRGMHDLLPEAYQRQHEVIERLSTLLARAGYLPVDTPVLERSDLFLASFGQELWQNLYAFRLHNRDLCLRPEYTASICRLYLDAYQQQPLPLRLQYAGSIFRYEAPGRNRYRQHTQLGIELFGGHAAAADAEIVQLTCELLHELDITRYRLELGHIGVVSGFINRLHLDDHAARLLLSLMEQISRSAEGERVARERLEALYPAEEVNGDGVAARTASNGETARQLTSLLSSISIAFGDDHVRDEVVERFLWKMGRGEQRRQILYALDFLRALHAVAGPPPQVFGQLRDLLAEYKLDAEPLTELEQLVAVVEQCGVPREQVMLNLSLGRGVSYYTGLVFEIHAEDSQGFDTQLCGGGRYDRLVRAVGSTRDVPACGFAFGIERLLAMLPEEHTSPRDSVQALVIPVSRQEVAYALRVAHMARQQGIATEMDVMGHGVGAGLKAAVKRRMRLAFIVGEKEEEKETVTVRYLETGVEREVALRELAENLEEGVKEEWL